MPLMISMTCREVTDFLADYLADELPLEERAAFDEHLQECPACVAYLKSYERTVKLGRTAFDAKDEKLPEEFPEKLLDAILTARKRNPDSE